MTKPDLNNRRCAGLASLAGATLAAMIAMTGPGAANDIGVLAAVNKDVIGERPAEPPRQLVLREKLILDERIKTSEVGGGQVMFLDQTTLTLSPNSDILLDRYVYDPNAQSGDISVSVLKGAMRFVGGRITKTGVATIRTPSATIGIRGGIGHVSVGDDGGTQYMHIAGISSTITNRAGTVVVTREGGAVTVPPVSDDDGGGDGGSASSADEPGADGDGGGQETSDGGSNSGGGNAPTPTDVTTGTGLGLGSDGGAPQYLGVATPEMIEVALGREGGVGDGGLNAPLTAGIVQPGVEQIEAEVSGIEGATQQPPISTKGEQQETSFAEAPADLAEPPQDDIADDNTAETIATEIPQLLDGLEFRGQWDAIAGLSNGDFVVPDGPLAFQLQYSLTDQRGVVLVELPDTGDLAAPNLTTLDGVQVRGDEFLIIGDEDLTLVGDSTILSRLGGDAAETLVSVNADRVARGIIFIDYAGSSLANTDFVDGEIRPTTGTEVVGEPISTRVDDLRGTFDQ